MEESGLLVRLVRFSFDLEFVNLIPQWRAELCIDTGNPHYIAWAEGTMPDEVFADWVEENGTDGELAVAVANRLRYGCDEEGLREHVRQVSGLQTV